MVCSCQFSADNLFYRAVITNLPGRKLVDVFYVDFGNKERVHYSRLRVLLDEFLILPAQVRSINTEETFDQLKRENNEDKIHVLYSPWA